jgi:hypothetical protein
MDTRIEPRESKPSWSNLLLEEVKTVEVERWLRAADLEECRLCFHTPVALVSCFVFVVMDLCGIDLGGLIKQGKVSIHYHLREPI